MSECSTPFLKSFIDIDGWKINYYHISAITIENNQILIYINNPKTPIISVKNTEENREKMNMDI